MSLPKQSTQIIKKKSEKNFNPILLAQKINFLLVILDWKMSDRNKNRTKKSVVVTHGTGVYDLTTFSDVHPGGRKYLDGYNKKVNFRYFFKVQIWNLLISASFIVVK